MTDEEGQDEIALGLEILSVTIAGLAEDMSELAAGPPRPPASYADLAQSLTGTGRDIVSLAQAMGVLARLPSVAPSESPGD